MLKNRSNQNGLESFQLNHPDCVFCETVRIIDVQRIIRAKEGRRRVRLIGVRCLGRTRFKEFSESPERIPTNILTDRLERLIEKGKSKKFL